MSILLPLYIHPLESPAAWETIARDGDGVSVIVNVHNGPGSDPAYSWATELLRCAAVPMLGYVDLNYGRRPSAEVSADIEAWYRYPVEGIFFDQAPAAGAWVAHVSALTAQVYGTRVLNPGTRPHRDYEPLAELICTYEGDWAGYQAGPASPQEPDLGNAAHLVYGVGRPEGLVTDLAAPLPYCGIPAWLAAGVRG
jgi:hypothetical protein